MKKKNNSKDRVISASNSVSNENFEVCSDDNELIKKRKYKPPTKKQEIFLEACKKNNVVYIRKNLTRLNYKDFNCRDRNSNSPLYLAVTYNNIDVAKYLIELGSEIEGINEYGNTALHKAMLIGDYDMISLLLRKEADITALNDFYQTPIFFADKSISQKIFIPTISYMNVFKDYNQEEIDKIMRKELKINDKQKRRNIEAKERQKLLMMGKLPKRHIKTKKHSNKIDPETGAIVTSLQNEEEGTHKRARSQYDLFQVNY